MVLTPVDNFCHYGDIIMGTIASQITSLTIVYSTIYSDADQRKHQSSASLAFVQGIYRGPVNSPYKWPVSRKMFPFDNVIMVSVLTIYIYINVNTGWADMSCIISQGSVTKNSTVGEKSQSFQNLLDTMVSLTPLLKCCCGWSCNYLKITW